MGSFPRFPTLAGKRLLFHWETHPGQNWVGRIFSESRKRLAAYCADRGILFCFSAMKSRLGSDEKLAVLREADTFRKWYSLDDRRVCVLCDRIITGRMIDVWKEHRGGYHLPCPTAGRVATT